jgi:hypothetical protein
MGARHRPHRLRASLQPRVERLTHHARPLALGITDVAGNQRSGR